MLWPKSPYIVIIIMRDSSQICCQHKFTNSIRIVQFLVIDSACSTMPLHLRCVRPKLSTQHASLCMSCITNKIHVTISTQIKPFGPIGNVTLHNQDRQWWMIPTLYTIVHYTCVYCHHLDSVLYFVRRKLLSVVETHDIPMPVLFGETILWR